MQEVRIATPALFLALSVSGVPQLHARAASTGRPSESRRCRLDLEQISTLPSWMQAVVRELLDEGRDRPRSRRPAERSDGALACEAP